MVRETSSYARVQNRITRSPAVLDALKAYHEAICLGDLEPERVAPSFSVGLVAMLMVILICYPFRLAGGALTSAILHGRGNVYFEPLTTLIHHSVCSGCYVASLILGVFAITKYTGTNKYNYTFILLVSSSVWYPLCYLFHFHQALNYIVSTSIAFLMVFYIKRNIQNQIYTPKEERESQVIFVIVFASSFLLGFMLTAVY